MKHQLLCHYFCCIAHQWHTSTWDKHCDSSHITQPNFKHYKYLRKCIACWEYHKQFFQKLNLKTGEKASARDITHRPLSEKTPGTFTFWVSAIAIRWLWHWHAGIAATYTKVKGWSQENLQNTKKCTTMYSLEVWFGALFTGGKERRQNCPCAQLVNHHDIKTY